MGGASSPIVFRCGGRGLRGSAPPAKPILGRLEATSQGPPTLLCWFPLWNESSPLAGRGEGDKGSATSQTDAADAEPPPRCLRNSARNDSGFASAFLRNKSSRGSSNSLDSEL